MLKKHYHWILSERYNGQTLYKWALWHYTEALPLNLLYPMLPMLPLWEVEIQKKNGNIGYQWRSIAIEFSQEITRKKITTMVSQRSGVVALYRSIAIEFSQPSEMISKYVYGSICNLTILCCIFVLAKEMCAIHWIVEKLFISETNIKSQGTFKFVFSNGNNLYFLNFYNTMKFKYVYGSI